MAALQSQNTAMLERELQRSIPSPKHMEDGADIVEYIELFEANMEAREIPKFMWAQMFIHFLPAGAAGFVRDRAPQTLIDTYHLADDYFGNHGMSVSS